jgi:DNA-binding response OmpR family regulator
VTKVLLVDDDRDLVDLLTFVLRRAGFAALAAYDGSTARRLLDAERPDLVVLDVGIGAESGFDLLRELRRRSDVPVILLTARGAEDDKVLGLGLGADDYVTKPFSHRELVARIRASLRRAEPRERAGDDGRPSAPGSVLRVGPIALDPATHTVTRDGRPIDLTVTEFRLLHVLMARAGIVVPTRTILKQVWGYEDAAGTDVVRVTVYRLRRKLEAGASRHLLRTVPGVGVMFQPSSEEAEPAR